MEADPGPPLHPHRPAQMCTDSHTMRQLSSAIPRQPCSTESRLGHGCLFGSQERVADGTPQNRIRE